MKRNIPLIPILGIAGGLAIPALTAVQATSGTPLAERAATIIDNVGMSIYGYSTQAKAWTPQNLAQFWAPVGGSAFAHWVLTKSGINRTLAHAKLGFTL